MEALSAYSLPPGFGFHPTDGELISHYLKRRMLGLKTDLEVIPEVDIYKHEPWDLPAKCQVPTRDSKWHFFASRDKKYPNGSRSNRATEAGYWKSTGKDRKIKYQTRVVGTKKTLVFHEGRPPTGKRTDWIMHEYEINEKEFKVASDRKDSYVLCRVTKRDGWEVDGGNVGKNASLPSENEDGYSKQPIHEPGTSSPLAPEKPLSPSESIEDFDAWFAELFDPNFSGSPIHSEVNNEQAEGLSSLAVYQEPINLQSFQEISEDLHLLFPVDEFCEILQSESPSLNLFDQLDFLQQETHFPSQNINESKGIIQIRGRESKPPSSSTLNYNMKLQVKKMETKNEESLSGIFYDEKQSVIESRSISNARRRPVSSRSLLGMNGFFLYGCMMVILALICYFLTWDARRHIGSYSELEL